MSDEDKVMRAYLISAVVIGGVVGGFAVGLGKWPSAWMAGIAVLLAAFAYDYLRRTQ